MPCFRFVTILNINTPFTTSEFITYILLCYRLIFVVLGNVTGVYFYFICGAIKLYLLKWA